MVANIKKIIGIEEIQRPIPMELCKACIAGHQELEILQTLILKVAKFLGKLYIDIEALLLVTFLGFQYFFSIIYDVWSMFFMILIKIKEEIYNKLIDF